jgi:hypothetical protein
MDGKAKRLARKLKDAELAGKLVKAGLDTPRKIKAAKKLPLGKSDADKVRAVFPKT